ncbi:sugar phosphate nucleotidyltransferase [Cetobacterium somerae]|uniref:mannose-1-phosphate guanylyltransferase n=1 Tax=Cetobacterium somerae TaxID=188913 RepID=UPI001F05FD3E|nr:sugar phosphate nucleotidyltransferase [Cetobacterium somerae]UPO97407.1 sugar phosphate nucleotidyltransferase [Cetobacterium somerae]
MLVGLIMAGGSGERFWPLSTPEKPKQLLSLFSNKSMIRETVDRILPIIESDKIFIATNILQVEEIKKELPDIPEENIVIEPAFKDTAAAIGYTTLIIEEKFKNLNEKIEVVVLASDHLIKNDSKFRDVILKGAKEARENSTIVTLGIKPDKPETGYGYIEVNNNEVLCLNEIYKVRRFREKPNRETAEEYVASGKYLWNSGMFIFTTSTIFKNFEVLMPEHMDIFKKIRIEISKDKSGIELSNSVKKYFDEFEKISIDFGIMEYSKNIKVIPVSIGWNDIGSFAALPEIFEPDDSENIIRDTKTIIHEASNNIVVCNDSIVSLLGVKNLIIVKNGDNILICHKDSAQDIKKIVHKYNQLKKER